MSVVAALKDLKGQGAPADIGLFAKTSDIIMFQYEFSGTTYIAAIRAGVGGWVPVDVQTDADTTFDSALTLIGVLGAGRIFVMTATYNMSAAHTVIDNLSIVGEGKNKTIFNVTANINLFTCTLGAVPIFIAFMDFSVVLTNAPGDQAGAARAFYLLSGSDLLFSNVLVDDSWTTAAPAPVGTSAAYYIGNWAEDFGNITRVWMINCEADGRGVRNFAPIVLAGWDTGFVSDCRFKGRDSDVGVEGAFAPGVYAYRCLTVRFSHCVIEYVHRGVLFADSSASGNYSEDIAFVICSIRASMNPNYDFDLSIIGCNFIDSTITAKFADGCSRCRVIGCKTNAGQIQVDDSTRVVIADNEFIRATSGTGGIKVLGSSIVTIKGNQIYAATICIEIDSSSLLVIIKGNILEPIAFEATGIHVNDSTYVIFIKNTIYGSSSNLIYGFIIEGTSDYNVISWNIFLTADGDDFYCAFVGLNTIVENNLGDRMRDPDGSMTADNGPGVPGTYWTCDRQSGQVTGIDTSAVARVVGEGGARVIFNTQYPWGFGIPKITATLVDVNAGVTIDTVEVDDVDERGFDWAVNVTAAVALSECKLDWKARPTHKMFD